MVKLLKNEWRRYFLSLLILLCCLVGIAILIALCMVFSISVGEDESYNELLSNAGTVGLLSMLMMMIPFAGYVYPILSYATDVGKKGMIFLTPSPTWLVILSKLIFGVAAHAALLLVGDGLTWLLGFLADSCTNQDVVEAFYSVRLWETDHVLAWLLLRGQGLIFLVHTALLIMGSIALGRYASNSAPAQVLLAIVFYYLIGLIETLLQAIVVFIFNEGDGLFDWFVGLFESTSYSILFYLAYAIILYIICTVLTDKKVNLS
ncbi:MAG: hypothetical protein IJ496_02640 [Ruminococcus sp.]|nr:hypothetical protein [Ruminococcus sp.]